jgi:hypothetical protein
MAAMPPYYDLAPAWARGMFVAVMETLNAIVTTQGKIMAKVNVEQTELDNISTQLGSIADDLDAELAALNVPAGDLSGVQAVVDRLRNEVTVPTPAPEPTPDPAPPTE